MPTSTHFARFLYAALLLGALIGIASPARAQGGNAERQGEIAAGEVTVTVQEQFVNSFLNAVFRNQRRPSFNLASTDSAHDRKAERGSTSSSGQSSCASIVVLEKEKGGVATAVHFEDGRIAGPLAFSGSYSNSLLGCLRFEGWADTIITLSFDETKQTLNGNASVRALHLIGVPAFATSSVTNLVQNGLDRRINPIQILHTSQLAARVPIQGSGEAIGLRATAVRPEILPREMKLHITYDFLTDRTQ